MWGPYLSCEFLPNSVGLEGHWGPASALPREPEWVSSLLQRLVWLVCCDQSCLTGVLQSFNKYFLSICSSSGGESIAMIKKCPGPALEN
jgi:hypothetical protein